MTEDDCVVITITKGDDECVECPMCNSFIYRKNMSTSCVNKIEGHNVCTSCNHDLITQFFKNEKGGCIYCGDKKSTIEIPVEIPRVSTYNPVIINNTTLCSDNYRIIYLTSCLALGFIIACISIYLVGNVIFYLSSSLYHALEEKHTHDSNFSIENCIMGYVIWIIFGYILTLIIKLCINIIESCISIKNTCIKQ